MIWIEVSGHVASGSNTVMGSLWATVLVLVLAPALASADPTFPPGSAQDRPDDRAALVSGATAAIIARLPTDQTAEFYDLGAWEQRPGEVSVCGEMSVLTTDGRESERRAFLAMRAPEGWRFRFNPTATTQAEMRACAAERGHLMHPPGGEAPSRAVMDAAAPDLERRCPMAAGIFWTDHAMVCAGHAR